MWPVQFQENLDELRCLGSWFGHGGLVGKSTMDVFLRKRRFWRPEIGTRHQKGSRDSGFQASFLRELYIFEDEKWPDMLIQPGKWSFSKWADQLWHPKWVQIWCFCGYVMLSHSQKYAEAYHTDFSHLIGRLVFAFWWMGPDQAITYCQLPSLKLTVRPWKWMVGRRSSFLFGFRPTFRALHFELQGG